MMLGRPYGLGMTRPLAGMLVALSLTRCSSDPPDADEWRADLERHGVTYSRTDIWLTYYDAWNEACTATSIQPLVDRAHTELWVLDRTWDQVKINVEHACPDRVDELEAALG